MIIGITGTFGAGKGAIVEYLLKQGFRHYSARKFISDEIIARGLPVNRDTLVSVSTDLRKKHSASYIIEQLYAQAAAQPGNSVIESIRTRQEIEVLRQKQNFILLAIDADQKLRYQRIKRRGSETDQVSFEEFVQNEEREMRNVDPDKHNVAECISQADYRLINNGTLEELHAQIDHILRAVTG